MAISGTWTNELGSILTLQDDGNGSLSGTYVTAVGGPEGEAFPLTGSYTLPPGAAGGISVAWTVAWTGWGSTTSWCGLLFGDDEIVATWILASSIPAGDGWWQSMNVGMDTFSLNQSRSLESAQKAAKRLGASHPLKRA